MTNYTPADLTSWPLSNLLGEYGALAISRDRAHREADPVAMSEYEHGLTLVADEIERRSA